MELREILSRLTLSHGPNSSGEYMCKCPAHDDRTASLSVREGDGGKILLHCMAGCSTAAVLERMGLKLSDLFPQDSRKGKPDRKPAAAAPPRPAPPQSKPAQKPLGRLVKTYPYVDEHGMVLFEVCRFEAEVNGERTKTFRQRRYDPGNPKAKKDGYVWSLDGVRSVVYRLPEVMAAIHEGKTVYVVEGEKDADRLAELGYCATTNPGGASKQGATKWLPEHTKQLTGAHAVILPDNDAAGVNDRKQVAGHLAAVCKSVKLLDLCSVCPSLPVKGDITDMLDLMGDDDGIRALHVLEAETAPVDAAEAKSAQARDAAIAAINNLPGYCVEGGCICQWNEESPKRLCTFTAIVTGVVTRDDGVTTDTNLVIDGWGASGSPLRRVKVPAKAYRRMDWLTEHWDIQANIVPGTTAADKVRYAISEAGSQIVRRTTEYTHTGWRKINGRWVYLYQGGAIGAEGVTVDLGSALGGYMLDDGYAAADPMDDLMYISTMTSIIPRRISVPLIAMAFLTPLSDALLRAGCPPAFSTFLVGGSGARKSTIAALILSFFGRFTALSLPASFNDTVNYTRKKAFDLKDMLLVVDDYHPEGNLQDRKKMEGMAQQLSRAFGDRSQRGRLNADRTLAESMPPRAMCLISGEDMPAIGESGTARYYVINIGKEEIPADANMTQLQHMAANGALAHMMRMYIEWLTPQMDDLPDQLLERFETLRAQVQKQKVGHSRAPGTIAHLLIGYEMYIKFLAESGIWPGADPDFLRGEMEQAITDIIGNSRTQSEESREERPSKMFTATVSELLLTKAANCVDLTQPSTDFKGTGKGHIGYVDQQNYYLLPEASYVAVCEVYTRKTASFPLTQRMLYKQMMEDGLIIPDANGKKSTRNKSIGGKVMRLLWIPRSVLDGKTERREQQRMDFTEVSNDEVPFKD